MPAFRPDMERLTPQEELGGGIREPWRAEADDTAPVEPTTVNVIGHKPHRTRYSRRGGRSFSEPSDSELDPFWKLSQDDDRTPDEMDVFRDGLEATRLDRLKDTARTAIEPDEHYDDVRRGHLRWAAELARDASIADGAAHVLENDADPRRKSLRRYKSAEGARDLAHGRRISAEELVLSACKRCIFADRCELTYRPDRVVQALGTTSTRKKFVDVMSGDYGSGYVSCESVIDTQK